MLLLRDWRAGEWRVLIFALVLAVGSLATVGLFADRVRQALQQQAASLIAADLRITSTRPLPADYRAWAQNQGLRVVESRTFPSMVILGEKTLLVEMHVVEPGYPLRGSMEIVRGSEAQRHLAFRQIVTGNIPEKGTVWVDSRLLARLQAQMGNTLGIGAQPFEIAAQVVKDVDQSLGFASFAPRVWMNEADLMATGLLQEGSRITYRLMVAGDADHIAAFRHALRPQLSSNEKLEDVRDARPEIRIALERAEHFLGLAALTAAILAGVAMALAARHFVARHLDGCAVMRCLGAQQTDVLRIFLYQLLFAGGLAVLGGLLLGYASQAALAQSIAAMRDAVLPAPSNIPLFKAGLSGIALLFGFAFLPLLQLRRVPPLRVLRRELGAPPAETGLAYTLAAGVLSGLFLWQAGSFKLGAVMLAGLSMGLLCFGLLAWWLLHAAARFAPYLSSHGRHVLLNLKRHSRTSALQMVALSLGGMALLILTVVRSDLLQSWQDKLPQDTPNRFVVNIQPDQQQPLMNFFAQQHLPPPVLLPMIRGRLSAINGQAINGDSYPEPRARALVEREFNLSWAETMPTWNELVQGQWWALGATQQLSVEEGIAKTLHIKLGDILTYDVAGSRFSARVSSLRKVQWDSMRVNFFVIATPDLLREAPVSYLCSFYLPPEQAAIGDALTRRFPNMLVIDTDEMIDQVRGIMGQIAQVISVVFLFTLFSGIAVLYAALLSTQDERVHEVAILRTLGASNRYLRRMHFGEFALLGALSGLLAAIGAVLCGWILAQFVLEIPYRFSLPIWFISVGGGIVTVMLAAWLTIHRLVGLPPLAVLRE
jgi:putative ABC transport system permease protein